MDLEGQVLGVCVLFVCAGDSTLSIFIYLCAPFLKLNYLPVY